MRPPSIDVVICTYRRPELLRLALAAVLEQEYEGDLRVLVVHDQVEPDASLAREELTSGGAVRRVDVLRNDRTPGLAGARNTGILAGEAPLVAFCDDDDQWLPGKLVTQVAELERTAADVVLSGITVKFRDELTVRVPDPADLTPAGLARSRVAAAHPSTVMVRRAALTGPIGLVDERIPGSYGEDYDWLLRAVQDRPVAVVPSSTVTVLWNGQSYFADRWRTIIEAIDYLLAKHPVLSTDPRGLAWNHGRKAFAHAALGERREALRWAARSIRTSPREPRGYLAVAVSARLLSADFVQRTANRHGRGV